MKKKITIGTRGSKLALIYAKIAEKNINKFKPRFGIKFVSIKKVKTSNEVKKLVMNFNKNKRKLVSSKSNKKIILQNFISNKTGIGILNKYYSFYENLTKKVILNV